MRASVMLEKGRSKFACILAFDVPVTKEARELAEDAGVRIFTADIIYHLFDQFTAYLKQARIKGFFCPFSRHLSHPPPTGSPPTSSRHAHARMHACRPPAVNFLMVSSSPMPTSSTTSSTSSPPTPSRRAHMRACCAHACMHACMPASGS